MHATINLVDTVAVAAQFCQHRHVMLSELYPSVTHTSAGGHPPSYAFSNTTLADLGRDPGCWDQGSTDAIGEVTAPGLDVFDPTAI